MMTISQPPSDDGYVRVPKWVLLLGFAALITIMVLGLVTWPASPLANNNPVANAPRPVETLTMTPRTVTSLNRTLGDPNTKIALVEFGDFQ